jgi:hypothetical protein
MREMADCIAATWCKADPLVREKRCNQAAAMLRDIADEVEILLTSTKCTQRKDNPVADEDGLCFIDGLGWVVQCSKARKFVDEINKGLEESDHFVSVTKMVHATCKQGLHVVPESLTLIVEKLRRFEECAEDSDADGCDIGRDWLDALVLLGLLKRVQRSPALWEMTDSGEALLAAAPSPKGDK